MRVKVLRRLGDEPIDLPEMEVVVVENHQGTPIAVACEFDHNGHKVQTVSHVQDADFPRILRQLGFDKLCLCEPLQLRPPPAGAEPWRGTS